MKFKWSHRDILLKDIRLIKNFYIISIDDRKITTETPLMIKEEIFNERLKSYFLKDPKNISREEILNVTWNMYLSQGHFVKWMMNDDGDPELKKYHKDVNKWYISFIEISGPLGDFDTTIKKTIKN